MAKVRGARRRRSKQKQEWFVLELDEHVVLLPNPDDEAHGEKVKRHYEIRDDNALTCICNPEIQTGEYKNLPDGYEYSTYGKIIVMHHSFRDTKRIKLSLEKIGLK